MKLFWIYLAAGAATLTTMLWQHFARQSASGKLHKILMQELHPERRTIGYRLVSDVFAPSLAGILVVLAWPVAIIIMVLRWRKDRRDIVQAD